MTTPKHKAPKLLPYLLAMVFASVAICAEAQPDLVPTRLQLRVTNLATGECEIQIKWVEVNRGDQPSSGHVTNVYLDVGGITSQACSEFVDPLAPKDRFTSGGCLATTTDSGTVTAEVFVDDGNQVSETNEGNNTLEATARKTCE